MSDANFYFVVAFAALAALTAVRVFIVRSEQKGAHLITPDFDDDHILYAGWFTLGAVRVIQIIFGVC